MNHVRQTIMVLCICFNLIEYKSIANTYYVDQSGSGDYISIGKVAGILKPGDSVYVREGVYNEYLSIEVSGTSDEPITISAIMGKVIQIPSPLGFGPRMSRNRLTPVALDIA